MTVAIEWSPLPFKERFDRLSLRGCTMKDIVAY
jgi:hypothetical protein